MSAARPRKFVVLGDPVDHSLSPGIFAWLFGELGIDASYEALRVREGALGGALASLRSGGLAGASVTLPHKEAILPLLDEVEPRAARIGALNCVYRGDHDGQLRGANTDAEGFERAIERAAPLAGRRVLLLGAGGAARAALAASIDAGARSVVVANRSRDRADSLVRAFQPGAAGVTELRAAALEAGELEPELAAADMLVNATRVGLSSETVDPLPPPLSLGPAHIVLDMVYSPLETPLLARARRSGASCIDGLWMLVHQATAQLPRLVGMQAPDGAAELLHGLLGGSAG